MARILAACSGEVTKITQGKDGAPGDDPAGSYGVMTIYNEKHNITCRYIHCKANSHTVKKGDKVTKGQYIADQGKTGTRSDHLHFEIHPGNTTSLTSNAYDPMEFIPDLLIWMDQTPANHGDVRQKDMETSYGNKQLFSQRYISNNKQDILQKAFLILKKRGQEGQIPTVTRRVLCENGLGDDKFCGVTTSVSSFTPSGNYDLDPIPGTYLDNSGNPVELVQDRGQAINIKIAEPYFQMKEAAKAEGIILKLRSGFRSPYISIKGKSSKGVDVSASSQDYLYTSWIKQKAGLKSYTYNSDSSYAVSKGKSLDTNRDGKVVTLGSFNLAARPGSSNHGNSIALDLNPGGKSSGRFIGVDKDIYSWLVKNSWKFGFIRTVAKEEWHFDYLPEKAKDGPYAKLKDYQKDEGTVRHKFYSKWGLDSLTGPDWGSTVKIT